MRHLISKTLTFIFSIRMITFVSILVLGSCSEDDALPVVISKTLDDVVTVPFFIENEHGVMPANPTDLLYEVRKKVPVVDMNGAHMTLADFSKVEGRIDVTCEANGVMIDVQLSGLVPNGVYTFWHVTFNQGGADPSKELLNIRGIGAVGKGDGSDNFVIASPDGRAQLSVFSPTPQNLSMIGDLKECPLINEEEWHIVGSYHLDGKTWGPDLGPDGTVVEQFGFVFKR